MDNISIRRGRIGHGEPASKPVAPPGLRENLRLLGSRLLPHDTQNTTCPPAALVSGAGPIIIVASIMRSGTHLLLDAMFNNFPALRRLPLFVDFDAYERGTFPPAPLTFVTGTVIKTHFPHTPLMEPYAGILAGLAARAVVLRPSRPSADVRRSLAKWGHLHSAREFMEIEARFDEFWSPFSPLTVDFATLLQPGGIDSVIRSVAQRTGFKPHRRELPVMPAQARWGVYCDKLLTRMLGYRAPRINTTIGYRLSPKQPA